MRSSGGRIITKAVKVLEEQGIRVRAVPTSGPGTAANIAQDALKGDPDLVLALGGDGTINEIANGMVYSHVPLGILPAGTANVLATELGLGNRIEPAARMISNCVPERISIGRVETSLGSRYFLMMAGIGLDAHIVYEMNPRVKTAFGKVAYWLGGVASVRRWVSQFDAAVNRESHRCGFVLASRVRNYGGDLEIATNASLIEHDFEVVLFRGRNPLTYLMYFLGVATGTLASFRGITIERASTVEARCPEDRRVYVQVDGEYAGRLPARVEIVESALSLLMPADARQRLAVKVAEALLPAAS